MKLKRWWLIIIPIVAIVIGTALVHKRQVDNRYANFQVTNVQATKQPDQVIRYSIIKKFSQHRTKHTYYAELVVHTAKKTTLSLSNWYLLEGSTSQPNQFLSEDLSINGQSTNVLKQGDNVIRINTEVDQNVHPNLVVVANPHKGKYIKYVFKTLLS